MSFCLLPCWVSNAGLPLPFLSSEKSCPAAGKKLKIKPSLKSSKQTPSSLKIASAAGLRGQAGLRLAWDKAGSPSQASAAPWPAKPTLARSFCYCHYQPPLPVPLKVPLGSSLLLLLGAARVSPYQYQPVHSGEPNIRGALNLYTIEDRACLRQGFGSCSLFGR